MMSHNPAMKLLGSIVWVITALGAIHIGLMAMGYNVLAMPSLMNFAKPIEYIVGICGVLSLVMLAMHGRCDHCGTC